MSDVIQRAGLQLEAHAGATSEEAVRAFEARHGIALPSSYREFLLRYNGGKPTPPCFQIPGRVGRNSTSLVHWFFSVDELETYVGIMRGRLPSTLLEIGVDPGAYGICLGVAGEDRGAVVLWDADREPEVPDGSNLVRLAGSFDEFVQGLVPEE